MKWVPGLRLDDRTDLPSTHKAVRFERQLVKPAQDEAVPDIELRRTVIPARVICILQDVRFVTRQRIVIERLRIGVGGQELQPAGEMLVESDPQRVVVRVSVAIHLVDGAESASRMRSRAL